MKTAGNAFPLWSRVRPQKVLPVSAAGHETTAAEKSVDHRLKALAKILNHARGPITLPAYVGWES